MEQSRPSETKSGSLSQDNSRLVWNPMVHVFTTNRLLSLSCAIWLQSTSSPSSKSILILPTHRRLGLQSGFSFQVFRQTFCMHIIFYMGATCPANPILHFNILIAFPTNYEAPHYALCSRFLFAHFILPRSNILITLFSNTFIILFFVLNAIN
jgi:hypothetical protein